MPADVVADAPPDVVGVVGMVTGRLGGRTGSEVEGHDWEYLLNAMGVSHRDHAIATTVHAIGALTMVVALIWAALVVLTQRRALR